MTDSIVVEFDPSIITKEEIKTDYKNLVANLLGQQIGR
jgi:hypothetical protein